MLGWRTGVSGLVVLLVACVPAPLPASSADEGADESGETTSVTEPDLGETTDDALECDEDARSACVSQAFDAWDLCQAGCSEPLLSCVDEVCEAACEIDRITEEWACEATHCPRPIHPSEQCLVDCDAEAVACASDDCEVHECSYGLYTCLLDGCSCATLALDFAWAGSCELVLPGPIPTQLAPYGFVSIGAAALLVAQGSCDEPANDAVFNLDLDRVTLCGASCQAFAEVGLLRFEVGTFPCE